MGTGLPLGCLPARWEKLTRAERHTRGSKGYQKTKLAPKRLESICYD